MFSSYFKYLFAAKGAHKLHSPFVYEFYTEVMQKAGSVDDTQIIDLLKELRQSSERIDFVDLGAGSRRTSGSKRSVSEIAKNSAVSRKYGRLLASIVKYYKIKSTVELGTSLGIGTLYLSLGSDDNKITTLEGSSSVLELAKRNFEKLGRSEIHTIEGPFDDNLQNSVTDTDQIDLVYIDGNHTYQATMDYFNFFLEHTHDDSFIIFDDIHWSKEMEKAWDEICASQEINLSMDLFRMGIVCKKPAQAKQHFVLRF